jgi:hypothetical protein
MIELMVYGYVSIPVPWLLLHIARWNSTTALHLGGLKKLALFLFGIIIRRIELFYGREGA